MIRKNAFLILLLLLISIVGVNAAEKGDKLVWGINAIDLGPVGKGKVTPENLLAGKNVLSLNKFYRAGGDNSPVTPTECRIAYDSDTLYVVFRCTENNMHFPVKGHEDWYSQLYSATEQDACFPDKVDFFIFPDLGNESRYQFALTKEGQQFGNKVNVPVAEKLIFTDEKKKEKSEKVTAFKASVSTKDKEWIGLIRIPWSTIGGKPNASFGITPIRSRWRNSEVSSPVALDFNERPASNLYLETRLADKAKVYSDNKVLSLLPSGVMRWQRPALLDHPNQELMQQIWEMQQQLQRPTDDKNFEQKIYLTQRWFDLLVLEGFSFNTGQGAIVDENMYPSALRAKINKTLREKNIPEAHKILDSYLHKLDRVSRQWFADGSVGNILKKEWKSIAELKSTEEKGNTLIMHCMAADFPVDLNLSLPKEGGIRLYTNSQGYFKPTELSPLNVTKETGKQIISPVETDGVRLILEEKPFKITLFDPAGKEKLVINSSDISFRVDQNGKIIAVDFRNHLDRNEVIYGFGEKSDRFNQNGNVFTLWGMDVWNDLTVGLRNQSYKPIPIFHSSKGYMVFDNSSYRLRADIGNTRPDQYRISQFGPIFDYYIWVSTPEKALQSYTSLTGKPILPPKWAFEPWMGRTGRSWTNDAPDHDPVAEQMRVVKKFAELDIPHSAIYAEGIGANTPALHSFMAPRGIKVLSWYYPAISPREQKKLMAEYKTEDLPILKTDTTIPNKVIDYVDFTNPLAKEVSKRWWELRLDLGVAGSMIDFGDRVPEDAVFYDGRKGAEMHNFYSYDYHRTYSEVFRDRRGDDYILFGRAAAPGTQKFAGQFSGDVRANFVGLYGGMQGVLNLSACGFSTWGSDLGGFRAWAEPEVYMRWTQFACFSPLMRCHGRTPREPWNYGDKAVPNYKYYTWVRENLLNYIYNAAVRAHETGIPMMRSMAIAFPEQVALAGIDDQYMFGRDLLVAPVVNENHSRSISFPAGKWIDLWSGKALSGSTTIQYNAPIETIPVFMKEGSVIPVRLNSNLKFGESMTGNQVNALMVTAPKDKEKISLVNDQNKAASVSMQENANSFSVQMNNLPEMLYLIIYDTLVKGVKIEGKELPQLKGEELSSLPVGWYKDSSLNRIVIRLPRSITNEVEISRSIQ